MARDWLRWHEDYDSAGSSLARRLEVVQAYLERALTEAPAEADGSRRLISMCAGEGRDVLPVLARHDEGHKVRAVLAELNPELARRGRATAAELGLSHVAVRTADAGLVDTYLDMTPAHVVLACGVFGNVESDDMRRTVAALPTLLVPGGIVIWTRGRSDADTDASIEVQECFAEHGFEEVALTRPANASFRVGMCLLGASSAADPVPSRGRLFAFV